VPQGRLAEAQQQDHPFDPANIDLTKFSLEICLRNQMAESISEIASATPSAC
jgi:hypothetical protein